jgi:hypothetical protein
MGGSVQQGTFGGTSMVGVVGNTWGHKRDSGYTAEFKMGQGCGPAYSYKDCELSASGCLEGEIFRDGVCGYGVCPTEIIGLWIDMFLL